MKLVFATGNAGKLREAREILGPHGIEVVSPYDLGLTKEQVDVEETGSTFEENAIIKVQNLWNLTGMPALRMTAAWWWMHWAVPPAFIPPAMPPSTAPARIITSHRISTASCTKCRVSPTAARASSASLH